jgi:hypothetical protein
MANATKSRLEAMGDSLEKCGLMRTFLVLFIYKNQISSLLIKEPF